MLYPAYWLVIAFVGFVVLFWLAMLLWGARTGLFSRDSETLTYKALDDWE